MRMTLNLVTEEGGAPNARGSRIFLPDEDVIEDLCAVLSLLSRRLVTATTEPREKHDDPIGIWPLLRSEVPMPVFGDRNVIAWRRRPATVITSWTGQEFKSNDPPPVGVDPEALAQFLVALPSVPNAEDIVYAARLYKSALELIEDRPDTAYLALVSVVKSFVNVALSGFEPDEAERVKFQAPVEKRAREFGLCDAQARALALDACKGQRWLRRKFVKFCVDYCRVEEDLKNPDRVSWFSNIQSTRSRVRESAGAYLRRAFKKSSCGIAFPSGDWDRDEVPGLKSGICRSIYWVDWKFRPCLGSSE